jgi:hypothetical protein
VIPIHEDMNGNPLEVGDLVCHKAEIEGLGNEGLLIGVVVELGILASNGYFGEDLEESVALVMWQDIGSTAWIETRSLTKLG